MRNMQNLNARHRIGASVSAFVEHRPAFDQVSRDNWVQTALQALGEIRRVVSRPRFAHPASLTQEDIMQYALALLSLRECASEAGFERLANACDAMAVTVSRLLEDQSSATQSKCDALRLFAAHAQMMIDGSNGRVRCYAGLNGAVLANDRARLM